MTKVLEVSKLRRKFSGTITRTHLSDVEAAVEPVGHDTVPSKDLVSRIVEDEGQEDVEVEGVFSDYNDSDKEYSFKIDTQVDDIDVFVELVEAEDDEELSKERSK